MTIENILQKSEDTKDGHKYLSIIYTGIDKLLKVWKWVRTLKIRGLKRRKEEARSK